MLRRLPTASKNSIDLFSFQLKGRKRMTNRFSMNIDNSKTQANSWSNQSLGLNSTLSALPVLLAQLTLEDLAISILGQLRDKLDRPRFLIAGQVLPAESIYFLLSYCHARTQCYDRLDTFAPQWVGNTDHCDFVDRRVLEQDLLDLPWVDIIASANDHIFLTVEQVEVALCIHHTDIARMQPSPSQRLSRFVRSIPVPHHDNASSCGNFANLPGCHLVIVVIDDTHLHIGAGNPCRSEAPFRIRVAMRYVLFSPQVEIGR